MEQLGFRYAEVLRDNLAAKFDVESTPFDETAFFEVSAGEVAGGSADLRFGMCVCVRDCQAVYKFVSHVIRKFTVNQKALCPQIMWKELDIELGRVFRGEVFNLEKRGLVAGSQIGVWVPAPRKSRHYKKINIHKAISSKSPAVDLAYTDEDNRVVAQTAKLTRPSSAPLRRAPLPKAPSTVAPVPLLQGGGGPKVEFSSFPLEFRETFQPGSQAKPSAARKRPTTAGPTRSGAAYTLPGGRPASAKTRPSSAKGRPSSSAKAPGRPKHSASSRTSGASGGGKRPTSATTRPTSATSRQGLLRLPGNKARPSSARMERMFGIEETEKDNPKPWSSHENWKPALSLASRFR